MTTTDPTRPDERELRAHIIILQNTVEDRERSLERAHALTDELRAKVRRADADNARLREALEEAAKVLYAEHKFRAFEQIHAALNAAGEGDDDA